MKKTVTTAIIVITTAIAVNASVVSYNSIGGTYVQNFNGLPTTPYGLQTIPGTGPHHLNEVTGVSGANGWYISNYSGSSANTEFRAQNGSLAGGSGRGVVSFGIDGDSDRALGVLATSNQVNRFGLYLQNTTGTTLNEFSLSFFGEQWREGNIIGQNTLTVAWSVFDTSPNMEDPFAAWNAVPELTFTALNTTGTETARNGNAPEWRQSLAHTVTGLNWGDGEFLVIRWTGVDLSGQDNGLAIDDLSFTAAIPEPGTIGLLALGLGAGAFAFARRRIRGEARNA